MKTKLFPLILALILAVSACTALAEDPNAFSFRNGITFGMTQEGITAKEAENSQAGAEDWQTFTRSNWLALYLDQTVKVSEYEAQLGYFLADNRMEIAAYDFREDVNAEEYAGITKAVTAVYGEGKEASPAEVLNQLERLAAVKEFSETELSGGLVWSLENVTVLQYYYAGGSAFALMYFNPDFDYSANQNPVDTTGI